jgi:UDP-N-acetylmuramoylalanine--D-glutamate ligase
MQRKLVILGAGESGVGAAILAQKQGYDTFVSDGGPIAARFQLELETHGIPFESGMHSIEFILKADEIVKSPGIPEKNELVKQIRKKNIPIISEIELAYRHMGDAKVIAITGSNGKTTTTSLIYHICVVGGLEVALVGNIGFSFAKQVALNPKPWYVAEISSFQLDDIVDFRPHIAVLTNITEDHLDRYDYKFEKYIKSKFRVAMNQTAADYFVYCEDDPVTMENLTKFNIKSNLLPITMNRELNKGAFIRNGIMTVQADDERMQMSIYDFTIKGKHNQYNSMAAGITASQLNIRKDKIREAIGSFKNNPHRMELAGVIRGVEFINDSKATNINSTWFALESMDRPVVLILGGVDKGNDYSLLLDLVKTKVKAIVCMGKDNVKIKEAFDKVVPLMVEADSAAEAVELSFRIAEKGDAVLLSPACASFDLFKNYEDRGNQFKEAVKKL